jgi:glutathione S-transferase
MTAPRFTLHHAPRSRSSRILWLLEEAGAPYTLAVHDLQKATHKDAGYLAVNPAGKVPALVDHGPDGSWSVVVTESSAICNYVADAWPDAGLAPPIGSPLRGPYLTWLAFSPGVIEPAFADMMFPRAAEPPASSIGWARFDAVVDRLDTALERGPWLLGDTFSAADVLVGSMLQWLHAWGKLPARDHLLRYLKALGERPANQRAIAKDVELAKK